MMSGEEYLPKFWTKKEDIPDEAFPIVCRTVLSGHSGVGIVIADNRDDLVPANLYVIYVKKKEEYSVNLGILDINDHFNEAQHRSEARSEGKECVSTCSIRGWL